MKDQTIQEEIFLTPDDKKTEFLVARYLGLALIILNILNLVSQVMTPYTRENTNSWIYFFPLASLSFSLLFIIILIRTEKKAHLTLNEQSRISSFEIWDFLMIVSAMTLSFYGLNIFFQNLEKTSIRSELIAKGWSSEEAANIEANANIYQMIQNLSLPISLLLLGVSIYMLIYFSENKENMKSQSVNAFLLLYLAFAIFNIAKAYQLGSLLQESRTLRVFIPSYQLGPLKHLLVICTGIIIALPFKNWRINRVLLILTGIVFLATNIILAVKCSRMTRDIKTPISNPENLHLTSIVMQSMDSTTISKLPCENKYIEEPYCKTELLVSNNEEYTLQDGINLKCLNQNCFEVLGNSLSQHIINMKDTSYFMALTTIFFTLIQFFQLSNPALTEKRNMKLQFAFILMIIFGVFVISSLNEFDSKLYKTGPVETVNLMSPNPSLTDLYKIEDKLVRKNLYFSQEDQVKINKMIKGAYRYMIFFAMGDIVGVEAIGDWKLNDYEDFRKALLYPNDVRAGLVFLEVEKVKRLFLVMLCPNREDRRCQTIREVFSFKDTFSTTMEIPWKALDISNAKYLNLETFLRGVAQVFHLGVTEAKEVSNQTSSRAALLETYSGNMNNVTSLVDIRDSFAYINGFTSKTIDEFNRMLNSPSHTKFISAAWSSKEKKYEVVNRTESIKDYVEFLSTLYKDESEVILYRFEYEGKSMVCIIVWNISKLTYYQAMQIDDLLSQSYFFLGVPIVLADKISHLDLEYLIYSNIFSSVELKRQFISSMYQQWRNAVPFPRV